MNATCVDCGSNSIVKNGKKDGKYQQYYCHGCGSRKNPEIAEVVGVIGDIHAPFSHPRYMEFIKNTFADNDVNRVVFIGDITDNHSISRHKSETDAKGASDEFSLAKDSIKQWTKVFPEATLTLGNHDTIPLTVAKEIGLPSHFFKSFHMLWGLPNSWHICDEIIINNVMYCHGTGNVGKDGAINLAIQNRMSTVIGHSHSNAGCKYNANPRSLIFGLNVGCGFDVESYAARYGKHFSKKPILGCGIVKSDTEAYFVPMDMNKYSREAKQDENI